MRFSRNILIPSQPKLRNCNTLTPKPNLDDADLVCNIKSIVIWCKVHVSLLLPIRPVKQKIITILSGKMTVIGIIAPKMQVDIYLIRVLTFFAWMSYIFLTAALIFFLSALRSTMKTRVLLSSIFFIADSVVRGYFRIWYWSSLFLPGALTLRYFGSLGFLKVFGR
jgi:hypothetical protein